MTYETTDAKGNRLVLPDHLEIRDGRLFIDGELFPYATTDGYTLDRISARPGHFPCVTLSIPAMVGVSVDHTMATRNESPVTEVDPGS